MNRLLHRFLHRLCHSLCHSAGHHLNLHLRQSNGRGTMQLGGMVQRGSGKSNSCSIHGSQQCCSSTSSMTQEEAPWQPSLCHKQSLLPESSSPRAQRPHPASHLQGPSAPDLGAPPHRPRPDGEGVQGAAEGDCSGRAIATAGRRAMPLPPQPLKPCMPGWLPYKSHCRRGTHSDCPTAALLLHEHLAAAQCMPAACNRLPPHPVHCGGALGQADGPPRRGRHHSIRRQAAAGRQAPAEASLLS